MEFKGGFLKQYRPTFASGNVIDLLNVSELDWLFGAAKLTQNPDRNKCSYSGYGIVFDSHFGVGNGSLVNTNNKKKIS